MRLSTLAAFAQALLVTLLLGLGTLAVVVLRQSLERVHAVHAALAGTDRALRRLESALLRHAIARNEAEREHAAALLSSALEGLLPLSEGGAGAQSLREVFEGYLRGETGVPEALETLEEFARAQDERWQAAEAAVERRIRAGIGVLGVTAAGSFVLVILLGGWFARRVTTPLARLAREVDAVAAGQLLRRVPELHAPEAIPTLARAFNQVADRLQRLEGIRQGETLLLRAALERLMEAQGTAAGFYDDRGVLLAAEEKFRRLLAERGLHPREALEEARAGRLEGLEVLQIGAAGGLRGYLLCAGKAAPPAGAGEKGGSTRSESAG